MSEPYIASTYNTLESNKDNSIENALNDAERQLAEQLKETCNEKGVERDPSNSARLLHKLGRIYHKRGHPKVKRGSVMISLIRSAALYNAAIARSPDNVEEIEQDLQQLCDDILVNANHAKTTRKAYMEEKHVNLIEHSKAIKKSIGNMRKKVLVSLPPIQNQTDKSEILAKECEKISFFKNLQDEITTDYKKILADLAKFCHDVMGQSPCNFAIAGMGSLARKEITPYSDFEHIILLQDAALHDLPECETAKIIDYFKWLSVIFQTILINLRETIIPSLAIPSLNSKENGWSFHDAFTPRGVSFDGMMPHACKSPLGRQEPTKDKSFKTELIKPVEEMLNYLNSEESLKNGYHLADVLTKTCFVYGNQDIYSLFEDGVYKRLDEEYKNDTKVIEEGKDSSHNYGKMQVKSQIVNDLKEYATRSTLFKVFLNKQLNIKKIVYRSTTLFIAELGRICNIHTSSCFDIIEKLAERNVLSQYAKRKLMYAVAVACEIRLRWYMKNGKQTDHIESSPSSDSAIAILKDLIGKLNIISYFQIAYALQCDLASKMNLKKMHFYSNPMLLNLSLHYYFDYIPCARDYQSEASSNKRLLKFDECLKELESQSYRENDSNSLDGTSEYVISMQFYEIGTFLKEVKIYDDAIYFFLMSIDRLHDSNCQYMKTKVVRTDSLDFERHILQPHEFTSNSKSFGLFVACLLDIGDCYLESLRPHKAMEYFEAVSDYLNKGISHLHEEKEKNVSLLHGIGSCFIFMGKYGKAKKELEDAPQMINSESIDVKMDKIADICMKLGLAFFLMNKQAESKKHYRNALQYKKELKQKENCPKKLTDYLLDMSNCAWYTNKKRKAINYLEKALKIKKEISRNPKVDIEYANILGNKGLFLMETDPQEASKVFENSLEIFQKASLDGDADRNMAMIFLLAGKTYGILTKHKLSKYYTEQALLITKRTCVNEEADILFLSCV